MIDYCPAVHLISKKIIYYKKKYVHKVIVFDICHFCNDGYAPGVTKY